MAPDSYRTDSIPKVQRVLLACLLCKVFDINISQAEKNIVHRRNLFKKLVTLGIGAGMLLMHMSY